MSKQPKIYSAKEHGIQIDMIDRDALYVLEKLRANGYEAYLVGGGVRDLLLGLKPKDFDISTSAKPEEIKALFRRCILVGKRFRLAHLRFGKKVLEVSTFRAGDPTHDALIKEDNIWGSSEEDVLRRDFTINGMFYDASEQTVIDYVGGYPDIQEKFLKTIGKPYIRFKQDPVRMIRCLKFRARYSFEVDKETEIALLDCKAEITKSSSPRILEELLRMLESGSSKAFFHQMIETGILQILFPALSDILATDVGQEVLDFLSEVDATCLEPHQPTLERPVLLSALLFPILQAHIKKHFIERDLIPNLGDIQIEVSNLVHEIFSPFFRLPRRIKALMVSLLTSQYRITPLEKRKMRRVRIPRIPDFHLAIHFFELRTRLEPGYQELYQEWKEAFECHGSLTSPKKRPRKRKRAAKKNVKKTENHE